MAGPKEVAIGVASMLGTKRAPNPLTITFRGQPLREAADIVRMIVSECDDARIVIKKIEIDQDLEEHIRSNGYGGSAPLVAKHDLPGEIKIYS